MPLLTRQFLTDIGIDLDAENYHALEQHFEDTLHNRVIDEVVQELDSDKAAELAGLSNADDVSIQQWLIANVPDLAEIVSDEVDILLGEVAEHSEAIDSV